MERRRSPPLRAEALTWVNLDHHPHIVWARWMEVIEGFLCLVLEQVPGGDLGGLLAARGPLPAGRALSLALDLCDAMAHAHDRSGVVHRDIKPSNCLLTVEGRLKIGDFGLARAFGERGHGPGAAPTGEPCSTTPAGSLPYMAPEQHDRAAILDTRADIHALGVMLYEMLTGDRPLSGSRAEAHVLAGAARRSIPPALADALLHLVARSPADRPPDFDRAREMLTPIAAALGARPAPRAKAIVMGPDDLKNKAIALVALRRDEEALACFEEALARSPDDAALWKGAGVAHHALGRYTEALRCHRRGLAIAPGDPGLWNNMSLTERALGNVDAALACCAEGLSRAPRDPKLLGNQGELLHSRDDLAGALSCYDAALAVVPGDTDLEGKRGYVLLDLGRHEEAGACFEAALAVTPRSAALWRGLGAAWHRRGACEQAVRCYRYAAEIDPRRADVHRMLGQALLSIGRPEEALAALEQAIDVSASDREAHVAMAAALSVLGRLEEACARSCAPRRSRPAGRGPVPRGRAPPARAAGRGAALVGARGGPRAGQPLVAGEPRSYP
ncbi:MAG: serine/threonine-protein kinase [Byssovorax sp.]